MLTFGSLFSGIEGFGLGFERAGMECVFQVEREPSCLKVLERHWPNVPRFKDVREFNATSIVIRPNVICGGFPCQDLSVAGRRAGLAGKRSGLFYEFMRIAAEFAPEWVVIENVAGLLSSNEGRDMGAVVGTLGQLGYGWAYRVFDAQWFGVPQQRRRVFVVGCLGGFRRAAEILFERESLPWDSPPSREARTRVAATLTSGVAAGSGVNRPGRRREDDVNVVASALDTSRGGADDNSAQANHLVVASDTSPCIRSGNQYNNSDATMEARMLVAHTLTANGFDASEDGTGRGTPLVPVYAIQERAECENLKNGPQGKGYQEGRAFTLEARHHQQAVAFAQNQRNEVRTMDTAGALAAEPGAKQQTYIHSQGVRRLMPIECERLQGFPDGWTDGHSDSARYRMLGNAVAVPVALHIGHRLVAAAQ